jgi:hypothetical protein
VGSPAVEVHRQGDGGAAAAHSQVLFHGKPIGTSAAARKDSVERCRWCSRTRRRRSTPDDRARPTARSVGRARHRTPRLGWSGARLVHLVGLPSRRWRSCPGRSPVVSANGSRSLGPWREPDDRGRRADLGVGRVGQAQVLNLLTDLKKPSASAVFISHDITPCATSLTGSPSCISGDRRDRSAEDLHVARNDYTRTLLSATPLARDQTS